MTQSNDDEQSIIRNQSDCIDNMRDIIARVNNTLIDPLIEVQTNYTFTPFKERFQDDVVGASCNISVTYPTILDACSAPIADPDYCLVAFDYNDTTVPYYNNTYTFGGWGYWKYTEEEYEGNDIKYFEWVCDTRYGYFIGEEKTDLGGNPIYPMMSYFDNGYPDSNSSRINGYYIWNSQNGTTFECGAQSSNEFYNTDNDAVSYAPTTSDNGWVIPTEGWVKTFDADDSQDRSGNVYIFKTDCTDPKPSPTAAPIPPPSPSATPSVTPTVTPSITPSITPTATITPSPTPSPEDCSAYENVCVSGFGGTLSGLNDQYGLWTTGRVNRTAVIPGGGATWDIVCTGNTVMYTGITTNTLLAFDMDTPIPEFNFMTVTGGTIGCGNTINGGYHGQAIDPATFTCGGKNYPVDNFAQFDYGICPSPTPTPTSSVTPTTTPSITVTPTASITATPSVTPTTTITPTTSITPTQSITPTASVTVTPSITPTITPTTSVTPTVTPSVTATLTPTPTPSPIFYHIEAQNGDLIITQGGDFIDWFPL
jgi:hypothetical protein